MLRYLLFLLIAVSSYGLEESPLPVGNYFEGSFAKNIPAITSLVISIEKDEEEKPFSTDFLQKLVSQNQGSSSKEKVSLTDFRDMAADYLNKMTKHQMAMEAKTELRERIRDLRTENTKNTNFLAPYIEAMGNDETVTEYRRYMEDFTDIETRILEFFTLKKSETVDRLRLFSTMKKAPEALTRIVTDLTAPERIMRKILAREKFVDPILAAFYSLFRNHAILLTVARTAKEEVTRPEFLEKEELILNHKIQLKFFYENFIRAMIKANSWRESEGFKYASLFTKEEHDSLRELNTLPHSSLQNLFEIDMETEQLKGKYHYVTIKVCGSNQDVKLLKTLSTQMVTEIVGKCNVTVLRYPKSLAPNASSVDGLPQLFRRNAMSILQKGHNYDTFCAAGDILGSMENPLEAGLIAVAATRSHGDLMDDVYAEDGGYKISLDIVANHEYVDPNFWKKTLHQKSLMKVVGYFIQPIS